MPSHTFAKAPRAYSTAIEQLSCYLTPHRYRKNERFVATFPDYRDVHRSIAQDQHRYIAYPHRNYVQSIGHWFEILAPSNAHLLPAPNMEARIAFARLALAELRRHHEFYSQPVFFVTISPRTFVHPLDVASRVELHALKQVARQALAGCSFIGMIDFGLLKGFGKHGVRSYNNQVSTHIHALTVGATREQIQASFDAMGPEFLAMTGAPAGLKMEITADRVEGYLLYMLKAPLFAYNVKENWRSIHSGSARLLMKKFKLRPGDQLRMAAVLSEMHLDELLFAQIAGTPIAASIVKQARQPLREWNDRKPRLPREQIAIALNYPPSSRALVSSMLRDPSGFMRYLRCRRHNKVVDTTSSNDGSVMAGMADYLADLADL